VLIKGSRNALSQSQKGVQKIGDEFGQRYGVRFTVPMVHPSGEQMAQLTQIAEEGKLKTYLDGVFPLQEAGRAHTLIESGHVRGKLVSGTREAQWWPPWKGEATHSIWQLP